MFVVLFQELENKLGARVKVSPLFVVVVIIIISSSSSSNSSSSSQ